MINENEVGDVIAVWTDLLRDIPNDAANQAVRRLCKVKKEFAPTPAEIIEECQPEQSFYALQRAEEQQDALALQEDLEHAVPMPEHIRERLERHQKRTRVNMDES